MTELNLSFYIKTMQGRLVNNYTQEATGRFLLDAVNDQLDADKMIDFDSKKISRLVSCLIPVPEAIRIASNNKDVIKGVKEYFENKVLADLNKQLLEDLIDDFDKAITDAFNVSAAKKKQLLGHKENTGRFLAEVFLYVLNLPNKNSDAPMNVDDTPLLAEVNFLCPITHEPLVENIKGKSIKRYTITQIFPEDLSPKKEREFKRLFKKPTDLSSNENLIALSERSAEKYLLDPSIEEFQALMEIKKELSANYIANLEVNKVDLEEDIRVVLSALMELKDTSELEELEYDVLRVEEKIPDDIILRNDIQTRVVLYYRYIESVFSESDVDFTQIASDIKKCAKKFEKQGMNQKDLVYNLARWIRQKTHLGVDGTLACNVVVAFFVQNCEVFGR